MNKLLVFVGTVTVPKRTKKFDVEKNFVVDTSGKVRPKISWVSENLQKWFFGKAEEPSDENTLRCDKLAENSVDEPILAELGDRAETTMSNIFSLMEKQPNGEVPNGKDRLLPVDGKANIFYVREKKGVLRAVCVDWGGDGWHVRAYSVEDPNGWPAGSPVFSRN